MNQAPPPLHRRPPAPPPDVVVPKTTVTEGKNVDYHRFRLSISLKAFAGIFGPVFLRRRFFLTTGSSGSSGSSFAFFFRPRFFAFFGAAFGAALLVSAILLLIPRFRRFGAWFAAACFALLCAAHLSPWLGIEIPTVADGSRTDAGAHFYLSGSGLVASLLLAFLHPRQIDLS